MIPLDHLESVVQDPDFAQAGWGNDQRPAAEDDRLARRQVLLAACAGYNNTGLAVIDLAEEGRAVLSRAAVWNGLAFSRDGKRVFLAGGGSGTIHVFHYENGKLTPGKAVKPATTSRNVFLAGIAVHPKTGKLYVANEANHEVWVLDPQDSEPGGIDPRRAAPAFLRFRRRRQASLCLELGQPQREHHRHGNRPAGPRPGRRHPAQRHGPLAPTAGCSWPAPATTRST